MFIAATILHALVKCHSRFIAHKKAYFGDQSTQHITFEAFDSIIITLPRNANKTQW
jgi:hypothetical protein